jgi:hypothetical protein
MKNFIIKAATPLSLVVLVAIGSTSTESQANGDMDLFISNHYGETLALNFMRGKPPYNRTRKYEKNKKRELNQQSAEMSALEIDQSETPTVSSHITKKGFVGGHPDRAKRHSNRY